MSYQQLKIWILDIVELSQDAMHMHVGLVVFFLTLIFWRRRRTDWILLLPVALAAAGMEVLDLYDDYVTTGDLNRRESLHDFLNTIAWPVAIYLLLRMGLVMDRKPM